MSPERKPTTPRTELPKKKRRSMIGGMWIPILLTVGLLAVAGPFIWMLLGSIKTTAELASVPPTWLPEAPTLDNYRQLFERLDFPTYFANSSIVAGSATVANLLFCSMVGYALAKLDFAGRDKIFLLVLGTLMVPGSVTLVPLFVLMSNLGLVNTYAALILPFAATPFGVFLMRQFMMGIPDELLDAGRVDGASEFYLFWRVAMPLSTPALATLGILTFLAQWNNFLWPLVASTEESMYTLPVALATFAIGQHEANYGLLMAGAVVTIVPILVVFVMLQRYFTESIASTGLKG